MANWLDELRSKVLGGAPVVQLGAFGKHPGWDDHIEPIGLSSDVLLAARDILYVGGIGGVINAAMWDKKPEETLPQIAHLFCWNTETDTLIGRMWSSVDGKGRAKYPFIAVVHLGIPFSYSLAVRAGSVLSKVETQCHQAKTADEVRHIFAAGQEELRAVLALPPDGLGPEPDRAVCSRVARAAGLDTGDTFARAIYAVDGKLRSFEHTKGGVHKISLKMLEADVPAQQSRLPVPPDDSLDGIAFWQKAITAFHPSKLPLLFIHAVGYGWADLIMGPPTPKQLFGIRANEEGVPLASSVPYELDAEFRHRAAALFGTVCDLTWKPAPRAAEPAMAMPPPLPPGA